MASKEKVENRSREWVNDFRRRCTAKGQGRLKTSNIQVTVSHRLNKRSVSLTKTPTERQSLIVSVHPEPAPFPHEGTESRPSNHCTCHSGSYIAYKVPRRCIENTQTALTHHVRLTLCPSESANSTLLPAYHSLMVDIATVHDHVFWIISEEPDAYIPCFMAVGPWLLGKCRSYFPMTAARTQNYNGKR